ncbi:MAG: hypothetical protein KBC69_02345 [Candidatus Magasanikbacteria bacterium]|nr:hypothetical protein [Candidatus Magasanikbacteria bacterium]
MSRVTKLLFIFLLSISAFVNVGQALAQSTATSKFIPDCVLNPPTGDPADEGECRSVSIYIILLFNVVNYLFGIVGALALLFFIYGGFTMILSRGNSEQTKKGIEIISAAIIGLIVVFGAYMLVRFLGTTVGLKSVYELKAN